MARIPDRRAPFDPAKAARERNNKVEAAPAATQEQLAMRRAVKRPGLRPLSPEKSSGDAAE